MSRQIVGQALNNHPRVAAATRQKVQSLAAELGYHAQSNREARVLIARRYGQRFPTGLIAALLPTIDSVRLPLRGIPYFTALMDGMELEAAEREIDLILCTLRARGLPHLLRERGVDGVICFSTPSMIIQQIHALGLPLIIPDRYAPGEYCLYPDSARGIAQVCAHLIALGHTRIAHLGLDPEIPDGKLRLLQYRETLRESGLPSPAEWVEITASTNSHEQTGAAVERLLRRNGALAVGARPAFTALVCYNDFVAMGAIRCLRARGLDVPRQVSVTGFDDISPQYEFHPTITSIAFPRLEMGRRAVEILCARKPNDPFEPQQELFPAQLVVRDSTAPPAQ